MIGNELEDFNIACFILSTILAHENMNYIKNYVVKKDANNHLLDHPTLLYIKYFMSTEVYVVAFSSVCCCSLRLLSSATAPSKVQLTGVTLTSQNCCSSQRFLCFYLDFESDISNDTVDRTRDC